MINLELKVPDMACGACGEAITQAVLAIDPKATIKADLETKQVVVRTQASESSVREAISAAGYSPT